MAAMSKASSSVTIGNGGGLLGISGKRVLLFLRSLLQGEEVVIGEKET